MVGHSTRSEKPPQRAQTIEARQCVGHNHIMYEIKLSCVLSPQVKSYLPSDAYGIRRMQSTILNDVSS